jgi:hypothetical protein
MAGTGYFYYGECGEVNIMQAFLNSIQTLTQQAQENY